MNEAQRQIALEQELNQAPIDSGELPALVAEKSWLEELFDQLFAYLEDMLPESEWTPDLNSLSAAWEIIKYTSMALFCAAVLYLIYLIWRNIRGLGGHSLSPTTSTSTKYLNLQTNLEEALAAGDWPRALRLRWQVCLEHTGRPASTTIREALHAGWISALDVDAVMRGMFRPGEGTEPLFREFDRHLRDATWGGDA